MQEDLTGGACTRSRLALYHLWPPVKGCARCGFIVESKSDEDKEFAEEVAEWNCIHNDINCKLAEPALTMSFLPILRPIDLLPPCAGPLPPSLSVLPDPSRSLFPASPLLIAKERMASSRCLQSSKECWHLSRCRQLLSQTGAAPSSHVWLQAMTLKCTLTYIKIPLKYPYI